MENKLESEKYFVSLQNMCILQSMAFHIEHPQTTGTSCLAHISLDGAPGEERSIVSSMSGTTRDAIDTDLTTPDGRTFKLIDTAGIRRRTAVAGWRPSAPSPCPCSHCCTQHCC